MPNASHENGHQPQPRINAPKRNEGRPRADEHNRLCQRVRWAGCDAALTPEGPNPNGLVYPTDFSRPCTRQTVPGGWSRGGRLARSGKSKRAPASSGLTSVGGVSKGPNARAVSTRRSRRVRTIRSFAPGITRDNSGIRGMPTLASGLRISSQLGPVETIPQTWSCPGFVDTSPFGGKGVHDAKNTTTVSGRVPAADGGVGPRRADARVTRQGIRALGPDHSKLGAPGGSGRGPEGRRVDDRRTRRAAPVAARECAAA